MILRGRASLRSSPSIAALLVPMLAAVAFLSVFDGRLALTSVPFLRNPAGVVGVLLALTWLLHRKGIPLLSGLQRTTILFLAYIVVLEGLRMIGTGSNTILASFSWVQVVLLALIAADVVRRQDALRVVGRAFLAGVLVAAAYVVLDLGTGVVVSGGRIGFEGINLNRQAYWYGLGVVVLLWRSLHGAKRRPIDVILAMIVAGVLFWALALTASRGAFIGTATGIAALLVLSWKAWFRLSTFIVLTSILVGGTLLTLNADLLSDRLEAAVSGDQRGGRDFIAAAGYRLFLERPIVGYGQSAYAEIAAEVGMGRRATAPHNAYLQVALVFGVGGLSLWLALFGGVLWRTWRNRSNPVAVLLFCLLLSSAVYGLVADLGSNKYFWLLLGVASSYQLTDGDSVRPQVSPNIDSMKGDSRL